MRRRSRDPRPHAIGRRPPARPPPRRRRPPARPPPHPPNTAAGAPAPAAGPAPVSGRIATGGGFFLGVTSASELLWWGTSFTLNITALEPTPVPGSAGTAWSYATAGWLHGCAIRANDSTTHCFGRGAALGTGALDANSAALAPVLSDSRFVQLSAGLEHTCGVCEEARLWCWGSNTFGQLGAALGANATASAVPVEVFAAGDGGAPVAWAAASAGAYHTCALTTAGAAFCWGANAYGQLGTGAASPAPLPPTAVNGTWAAVSAGEQFTLAIDAASAELYGW